MFEILKSDVDVALAAGLVAQVYALNVAAEGSLNVKPWTQINQENALRKVTLGK